MQLAARPRTTRPLGLGTPTALRLSAPVKTFSTITAIGWDGPVVRTAYIIGRTRMLTMDMCPSGRWGSVVMGIIISPSCARCRLQPTRARRPLPFRSLCNLRCHLPTHRLLHRHHRHHRHRIGPRSSVRSAQRVFSLRAIGGTLQTNPCRGSSLTTYAARPPAAVVEGGAARHVRAARQIAARPISTTAASSAQRRRRLPASLQLRHNHQHRHRCCRRRLRHLCHPRGRPRRRRHHRRPHHRHRHARRLAKTLRTGEAIPMDGALAAATGMSSIMERVASTTSVESTSIATRRSSYASRCAQTARGMSLTGIGYTCATTWSTTPSWRRPALA